MQKFSLELSSLQQVLHLQAARQDKPITDTRHIVVSVMWALQMFAIGVHSNIFLLYLVSQVFTTFQLKRIISVIALSKYRFEIMNGQQLKFKDHLTGASFTMCTLPLPFIMTSSSEVYGKPKCQVLSLRLLQQWKKLKPKSKLSHNQMYPHTLTKCAFKVVSPSFSVEETTDTSMVLIRSWREGWSSGQESHWVTQFSC